MKVGKSAEATAPTPSRRLRDSLLVLSGVVAGLVVVILGILLIASDRHLTGADVRSSIGLNLLASVVFAAVVGAATKYVINRNAQDDRIEMVEAVSAATTSAVKKLRSTYFPVDEFAATDEFDKRYNRTLMVDMEQTNRYIFCGPSGRYVATRLKALGRPPQHVMVLMLDPQSEPAMRTRALDRQHWGKYAGQTVEQVTAALRGEILAATVALFDYRTESRVELAYTRDTGVYRFELTDKNAYISVYRSPGAEYMQKPPARQFGQSSMMYQILNQEVPRRFTVTADVSLDMNSNTKEGDVLALLQRLSGEAHTSSDLERLRLEDAENGRELRDFLATLGWQR